MHVHELRSVALGSQPDKGYALRLTDRSHKTSDQSVISSHTHLIIEFAANSMAVTIVLQSVRQSFRYLLLNGGSLMFSQRDLRNMIAAAAIVVALGITVHAADPFTLTSTTFKDGQMM